MSCARSLAPLSVLMVLLACSSDGAQSNGESDDHGGDGGGAVSDCEYAHGGSMQRVELDGDRFCIDHTEVTRAQYAEFVRAGAPAEREPLEACEGVALGDADPSCMENPEVCSGPGCDQHPQVCISLCDASAYCAWAGKELCGGIGSGDVVTPNGSDDSYAPTRWDLVCGGGLDAEQRPARRFPYGDAFEQTACQVDETTTAAVATNPACGVREYPKVVDMSGNVDEYVRSVEGSGHLTSYGARGGMYKNEYPNIETERLVDCGSARSGHLFLADGSLRKLPDLGFRCCAD